MYSPNGNPGWSLAPMTERTQVYDIARSLRQILGPRFRSAIFNPTRHDGALKIMVYLAPLSSKENPEPASYVVASEDLDRV